MSGSLLSDSDDAPGAPPYYWWLNDRTLVGAVDLGREPWRRVVTALR